MLDAFCGELTGLERQVMAASLAINGVRDFFWALQGANKWNSGFQPTQSASAQWGAQQLWSHCIWGDCFRVDGASSLL